MPHSDPRSRVTIEDLLRLKRAERPDPEFWNKFEAELRQKQLAALVERRRWWQSLPQVFVRRAYVPIGAAAVLTISLVSVRTFTPTELVPQEEIHPLQSRVVATAPSAAIAPTVEQVLQASSGQLAEVAEPEQAAAVQLSEKMPAQTGDLVPWSARPSDSPSARSIARNLASLEQTEPELVNSLLPTRVTDVASAQQAALNVAEIAAVSTAASASRRTRLLAAMGDRQFTPDPAAPEVVRERLARRLGDTELTGGWTRVGVKADRVSLKF
jgi:hypothetical protein